MNLATTFQDTKSEVQKKILSAGIALSIAYGCALNTQNANAEPGAQAVNHSPAQTQMAEPDDDFVLAKKYSKQNNTVAVWVCAPMGLQLKPSEIGALMEDIFKERGVPNIKAYSAVSTGNGTTVAVYIGGELYRNPETGDENFNINTIEKEIPQIIADYKTSHSTAKVTK